MRLRNYIFGIIAAAFCLSACEPADPEQKHEPMPCTPYALTRAQSEMVDGGNSFAFNLLEAVSNDENFTGKDSQSVDSVDTVSGATRTTRAYKNAIKIALDSFNSLKESEAAND